jgi:hypothetical protein
MNFLHQPIKALLDHVTLSFLTEGDKIRPLGLDMSIESMDTQQFSVGVFYLLMVAIGVFVVISFLFMFKGKNKTETEGKGIKRGEKILFIWIMFGVVVAVVFGAAQMTQGYLF